MKTDRVCEQAVDMERELLIHPIALKSIVADDKGSQDSSIGKQTEARCIRTSEGMMGFGIMKWIGIK